MNLQESLIYLNNNFNLVEIVLPFFLIFIIIYVISNKIMHFKDKGKKINVVLSLILSLLVVMPHVLGTYQRFDVVELMNSAIPEIVMVIIGAVLALIMLGSVGIDSLGDDGFAKYAKWASFIIVGIILWSNLGGSIYLNDIPLVGPIFELFTDPQAVSIILFFIVFAFIVKYIVGDDKVIQSFKCSCGKSFDSKDLLIAHISDESKKGDPSHKEVTQ